MILPANLLACWSGEHFRRLRWPFRHLQEALAARAELTALVASLTLPSAASIGRAARRPACVMQSLGAYPLEGWLCSLDAAP